MEQRHWVLLGENLVCTAGFSLLRESLLILGLYQELRARNACPLLHVIVMRDDEMMGQILVNA